ncbi:MAG: ABC transporter ATP-binding protein [Saprospiraceae bacterium]
MGANALTINKLTFKYPRENHACIEHLDLSIPLGSRFGLFGPNGAGKTTLLSLIMGVFKPDNGDIIWFGDKADSRIDTHKANIGFVPQHFSFYQELSAWENLHFFGAWAGMDSQNIRSKGEELLGALGLLGVSNKPVSHFSGGMKRRVNLAIGMLHSPQILLLDEPTAGVDVQSRVAILQYLLKLNKEGTTLIYTSHHLQEAEELCTEIAMIDSGKIVASDSLQNLLTSHQKDGLEGLFLHLTGKDFRD